MRINEVSDKKINADLSSDELIMIQNLMYFYEKYHHTDPDAPKPDKRFHELSMNITIAMNLCQYGHLDSFAIDQVILHSLMVNPEARLKQLNTVIKKVNGKEE